MGALRDAVVNPHRDAVSPILQAASAVAAVPLPRLWQLLDVAGLLNRDGSPKQAAQGVSRLNGHGAPYQVCVSQLLRQPPQFAVRLLLDPCFDLAPRQRLAQTLRIARAQALQAGAGGAVDQLAPFRAAPPVGAVWLAWTLSAGNGRHGLALYFNPEAFGGEAWEAITNRLDRLLPVSAERQALLAQLQPACHPVSLALELQPDSVRIKLYLRSHDAAVAPLAQALPALSRLGFALDLLQPMAPWPATGLTLSVGFDPASGVPEGCKLDFCLCSRCRRKAGVAPQLDAGLRAIMPAASPLFDTTSLALLGVAAGGKGRRLNAYFA